MDITIKKTNQDCHFEAKPGRGKPPKMELMANNSQGHCKMIVVKRNAVEDQCKKRKRAGDVFGVSSPSTLRAKELQSSLAPQYPSLVKYMLRSHVTGGFWLGLPKSFCDLHMPKHDTGIILEDESGEEYETKYLWVKVGLSAGWRGFSIAHKLLEGDVLVFQLVTPSKFKVYIVRSNGSDEVDGALGLLSLEGFTSRNLAEKIMWKEERDEYTGALCKDLPQENTERSSQAAHETNLLPVSFAHDNLLPVSDLSDNSEGRSSGDLDVIMLSDSILDFKEVKSIEDFDIQINGLVINSELGKHLRHKYYDLCCSQKSFLHGNLLEGLNCKLAAGMIAETINIADAIKASKITTPVEHMEVWNTTLKAFESMGMNVGFLCARMNQLMNLALKSKKYNEAKVEKGSAEAEVRTLEAKLLKVKDKVKELDMEIESLDIDNDRLELLFQEVAKAPW